MNWRKYKLKNSKFLNRLIVVWFVTFIVMGLLLALQEILPFIFKDREYMKMLMNEKDTVIPFVISAVVCGALAFVSSYKRGKIQEGVDLISEKKSNRFVAMFISVIFSVAFILIGLSSVVEGVVDGNNVKQVKGTVENVMSASEVDKGEIYTLVKVKDAEGKNYHLSKSPRLDDLKVNNKDKIKLDYVKAHGSEKKAYDGKIVGYISYKK